MRAVEDFSSIKSTAPGSPSDYVEGLVGYIADSYIAELALLLGKDVARKLLKV